MSRIIIVGPNVGMGGVERASANLANGLADLAQEVHYLALIPDDRFFELRTQYYEPDGYNRYSLNLLKTLRYIRLNVTSIEPVAIICFTKFYAAITNLALFGSSYRIYVTERSSPLYKWPLKVELICRTSFFLRKPKGVISQTDFALSHQRRYYGKTNYLKVPNPVRKITLYPEVARENIILAAGRFNDPLKGFDLLVKAFNFLNNTDWKLVFAGGTEEEGKYLLDFAEPEKKGRIHFLGAVKNMDSLYAKAGIFVMPSRSEGFPNALSEALCAGCCCVSFDFKSGPRDLIENGSNGIIVEEENCKKMAEALDQLISNGSLRLQYGTEAIKMNAVLNEQHIAAKILKFISN